jgi:hypothetical protein
MGDCQTEGHPEVVQVSWGFDWLIMMGWDYVSELRTPMGLLFIPQVICEHGEPWWYNDARCG